MTFVTIVTFVTFVTFETFVTSSCFKENVFPENLRKSFSLDEAGGGRGGRREPDQPEGPTRLLKPQNGRRPLLARRFINWLHR